MNVPRVFTLITTLGVATLPPAAALAAQQPAALPAVARLVAEPSRLVLMAGDSMAFKVTAYDAQGNVIANAPVSIGGPRRSIMFSEGRVKAFEAGTFNATATAPGAAGAAPVTLDIPVTITWPAVSKLEITPSAGRLYTRVTLAHTAKGFFAGGMERKGLTVNWKSSDPTVARVDRFGNVTDRKSVV